MPRLYVKVDNADEAHSMLIAEGFTPAGDPTSSLNGRREFSLLDPDGHELVFFSKTSTCPRRTLAVPCGRGRRGTPRRDAPPDLRTLVPLSGCLPFGFGRMVERRGEAWRMPTGGLPSGALRDPRR